MARIQDVAAAAGVSKATVSYVFSPQKSHLISPETRERVFAVAGKLGYQPSFLGKVLSYKRSFNAALILPSRSSQTMSRTLLQVFHGIMHNAETSEYNVSVFFGVGKRFFKYSSEGRFDGIIVIGLGSDTVALDKLAALGLPMVVANRQYPVSEKISCIYNDIAGWFNQEVDRMLQNGCKKILLLNKGLHADAGKVVADVFDEAAVRVKKHGSVIEQAAIGEKFSIQVNELLKNKHYDSIIINSSEGAEVVNVLKLHKLLPNRDIQLSGFVREPELRSLGLDWDVEATVMGTRAWDMLMELLADGNGKCEVLPVVRKTAHRIKKVGYSEGFDI